MSQTSSMAEATANQEPQDLAPRDSFEEQRKLLDMPRNSVRSLIIMGTSGFVLLSLLVYWLLRLVFGEA
jgi:hypothetical protein